MIPCGTTGCGTPARWFCQFRHWAVDVGCRGGTGYACDEHMKDVEAVMIAQCAAAHSVGGAAQCEDCGHIVTEDLGHMWSAVEVAA